MTITLDSELEKALQEMAQRRKTSVEAVVLDTLRGCLVPQAPAPETQDDWIRRLRAATMDCGVSLSDMAVGSEGIYD